MASFIGRLGIAVALAVAVSGSTARAQGFCCTAQPFSGFVPGRPASGEPSPLRAQVQYQLQVPSDRNASLDDQKSAIESGHAALYGLAERECDALRKAFDGDCRVVGLNVSNAAQGFGPSGTMSLNAAVTIEVTPRPPAQAAPPAKPQ